MKITQKKKIPTTMSVRQAQKVPVTKKDLQLGKLWGTLVNGIVRPPRAKYSQALLGMSALYINQTLYHRSNPTIIHEQKYKIQLAIFEPQYKNNAVILYLHGNSSSKAESLSIIRFLPKGFSLVAFDFIGCGKNQQLDHITLGYRQSKQAETVVKYLKNKCNYDEVIIWGRSMGAASALLYGKAPIIIADSSFRSLRTLSKQVAKQIPYVPKCLVNCCFPCIFYKLKKDVQERGNYDMDQCDVKKALTKIDIQTTLIFLSGDEDQLIHHRNSQKLYKSFAGKSKYLQIFKGNHNSKRPQEMLKKVMGIIAIQYQKRRRQRMQMLQIKVQNINTVEDSEEPIKKATKLATGQTKQSSGVEK